MSFASFGPHPHFRRRGGCIGSEMVLMDNATKLPIGPMSHDQTGIALTVWRQFAIKVLGSTHI